MYSSHSFHTHGQRARVASFSYTDPPMPGACVQIAFGTDAEISIHGEDAAELVDLGERIAAAGRALNTLPPRTAEDDACDLASLDRPTNLTLNRVNADMAAVNDALANIDAAMEEAPK